MRGSAGGGRNPGTPKPFGANGHRDRTRITVTVRIEAKILAGAEDVLTGRLDAGGEDLSRYTADGSGPARDLAIEFDEFDSKSSCLRDQGRADHREYLRRWHGRQCTTLFIA